MALGFGTAIESGQFALLEQELREVEAEGALDETIVGRIREVQALATAGRTGEARVLAEEILPQIHAVLQRLTEQSGVGGPQISPFASRKEAAREAAAAVGGIAKRSIINIDLSEATPTEHSAILITNIADPSNDPFEPYSLHLQTKGLPAEEAQTLAIRLFTIDPRLLTIQFSDSITTKSLTFGRPEGFSAIGSTWTMPLPKQKQKPPIQPLIEMLPVDIRTRLLKNRLYAGILGAVIGDALGVPVEYISREQRWSDPVTSMRDVDNPPKPRGTWSDDSSMMLGLMRSLRIGFNPAHQGLMYIRWFKGNDLTADGELFDIGGTTASALSRIIEGTPALDAGGINERDNGNGSLMRTLPLVFHGSLNGTTLLTEENLRALFYQSLDASRITHAHPRSQLACAIYTTLGRYLLAGFPLNEALLFTKETVFHFAAEVPEVAQEFQHFQRIFDPHFKDLPECEIESTGYVVHTLEAAIWSLLRSQNYEEAVLTAVNLGWDTDTTGIVAGGLAGIIYGTQGIPTEWIDTVARTGDIVDMIGEFYVAETSSLSESGLPGDASMLASGAQGGAVLEKDIHLKQYEANLDGSDYSTRSKAAEKLGELGSDEALAILQRPNIGLGDSVWMVRAGAVRGLALKGSERSLGLLMKVLREEKHPKVVYSAIEALGKSTSSLAHKILIQSFLGHRDISIRARASKALGTANTHEALVALQKPGVGLHDQEINVRKEAALSLALSGTKEAIAVLELGGIGLNDPSVEVQVRTSYGLGLSGTPESLNVISRAEYGLSSKYDEIKRWTAIGLASSGKIESLDFLWKNYKSDDPAIVEGTLEGIRILQTSADFPTRFASHPLVTTLKTLRQRP